MGRLAGLTEQTPGDLALDRFHPLPRPSVAYVICGADYCSRLDPTCEDALPGGGLSTSTCARRRVGSELGDTHQRHGSARCPNYERIRPIMLAHSPVTSSVRCVRAPTR